ncbi:M14 family zinc carboxypeptidase [Cytobacillus firmus]|uniref:M14 family zinc carboxypeptidase n=1 Tax=Cytobacillus firmus TaxID=1399 RepID=UPI0018CE5F7F|nr:M14 family zinc carboxypeptidase [Cytobacillus firmus]MBG9586575.1 peptidase M14 carboxypeptidase A [Cytobacillus firmus]
MKILKEFIFTLLIVLAGFVHLEHRAEAAAVNPAEVYTYEKMQADIVELAKQYPDLITYKVIGKSEYGRNIYAVSLGKGGTNIFINGSHHAREWMTTTLNMYMLEQYASAYKGGRTIAGADVRTHLNRTTMWFVPMVNPDGVTLQQFGLKAFPSSTHAGLIKMNAGSKDFKRWKANGKGVDLNRQYPADWANIKSNPGKPYYKNYKGSQPQSASEVKAIINFVNEIKPASALAYHSSGQILYWKFHQTGALYDRDHQYAKNIGKMTGYSLVYPGARPSGGGFTDWFTSTYKLPGFTPEIGRYAGETSLPLSEFQSIWKQNQGVGLYVAGIGYSLNGAKTSSKVTQATNQTNDAVAKSRKLRSYYSGNIKSTSDFKVSVDFAKAYQNASKSIASAETLLKGLPQNDQNRLMAVLKEAYDHKARAAVFIDTEKIGAQLTAMNSELIKLIDAGTLDEHTVETYHKLSYQIKKAGLFINKLYGPHVRDIAAEKYVLPAKITKETVIYEISRYMLMEEIQINLDADKLDIVESQLAELNRLERRSAEIKEAGNKLYPGKYRELPGFEAVLTEMKQEIVKKYEALKPSEEQPEVDPAQEQEDSSQELDPAFNTEIEVPSEQGSEASANVTEDPEAGSSQTDTEAVSEEQP